MTFLRILTCSFALIALSLTVVWADAPWTTHTTPDGFAVSAPQDWAFSKQPASRVVIQSPDHLTFAVIQPFAAKKTSSKSWLGALLPKMSTQFPHAVIVKTHAVTGASDETAASVRYGGDGEANVVCSVAGGHGMLFAIAAPKNSFATSEPMLLKVINSFHVDTKGDGLDGSAPMGASFVTWKDPKEAAFTNKVPRGWTVSGGLFRFATTDVRPQLEATSPDGLTHIQLGDSTMPSFIIPTPSLQMRGYGPGSNYALPTGVKFLVLNFRTGAQLSRDIVQNQWGQRLQNVQITDTQELPAPPPTIKVPGAQATAGMTRFSFEQNGQAMIGFVRTATLLLPNSNGQPGGTWVCTENAQGMGPDGQGQPEQLLALATQIQTSRQWSPTWTAKNVKASNAQTQQFTRNVKAVVARSHSHANVTSPESRMSHEEFMEWMRQQGRRRNLNFKIHMLRKEIAHQNFMHSEFPDQY